MNVKKRLDLRMHGKVRRGTPKLRVSRRGFSKIKAETVFSGVRSASFECVGNK